MVDVTRHGVVSSYNKGCRCDECRDAKRADSRAYYERHKDEVLARNKQWYAENRERAIAHSVKRARETGSGRRAVARWRERNPDYRWADVNPERKREVDRRYLASERRRQTMQVWRDRNRDRIAAYDKAWGAAHRENRRENGRQYRLRLVGAEFVGVTDRDWCRLIDRHRHRCAYCGEHRPLTQDHVIPITRGGRHAIGNIVPACIQCNAAKNDRLLSEWKHGRRRKRRRIAS